MPKTKISEYSATANSNTDVASINIDEGCAPSGINNAIRAIMGHLKDFQSGTSNDPFTVGSSGSLTLSYGTANGVAYLNGSKVVTTGSALTFDGTNLSTGSGSFFANGTSSITGFRAQTTSNYAEIQSRPDISYSRILSSAYLLDIATLSNQPILFTINSTEAMRLTSTSLYTASGINVGIGTSSPQIQSWRAGTYLTVANASTRGQVEIDGAVADSGSASLGALIFTYSTNTTNHKDVALIEATSSGATANQRGGVLNFYTKANGTASPALNMALDSSGNLLVQTTTATTNSGVGFKVLNRSTDPTAAVVGSETANTSSCWSLYSTGAGAFRFYVGYGGTVYATSTTITGISDQRLKENIRDLDDGLEKIMALQPRKFDWKEGKGADIRNARGFIAQEFETVFPDMIEEWRDPAPEGEEPYKAINANLIPTLVKALQEQQALITSLTERISALEAK